VQPVSEVYKATVEYLETQELKVLLETTEPAHKVSKEAPDLKVLLAKAQQVLRAIRVSKAMTDLFHLLN
jgi:hypothetical protein